MSWRYIRCSFAIPWGRDRSRIGLFDGPAPVLDWPIPTIFILPLVYRLYGCPFPSSWNFAVSTTIPSQGAAARTSFTLVLGG